ncbi:hypothetical protein TSUD_153650 [Trifolium subterraneum]|uniref:Uncharacterized protein n=1 Tax=Trifolium subterraneum TaxID=3900 RepID=A0A2Z6ML63_TRISU|nr:hypothetical protein TSUD_153650 [Trifolium subterraneum]
MGLEEFQGIEQGKWVSAAQGLELWDFAGQTAHCCHSNYQHQPRPWMVSSSKQTMHVHGFCYSSGGCHGGEAWHHTTPKFWGDIKDQARAGQSFHC